MSFVKGISPGFAVLAGVGFFVGNFLLCFIFIFLSRSDPQLCEVVEINN